MRAAQVERRKHAGPEGWKSRLQELIDANADVRMNGKTASHRTREITASTLFNAFRTLHSIGYRIDEPRNFAEKHVAALALHWHAKGYSVSTIQTMMSVLRKFAGWIGKSNMIKPLPVYLKDVPVAQLRRSADLKVSKSWTHNGIDIDRKIAEADALDERFGLMLRVVIAFGLRAREVVMLRPWKADLGDKLAIYSNAGPKTGKARMLPIQTDFQRRVLDNVKSHVPQRRPMGWARTRRGATADLKYQMGEWNRRLREIGITKKMAGVTGHGLRAEFSENMLKLQGVTPPVLGGQGDEMSRDEIDVARAKVSEMLGHSRLNVTNSYYGAFKFRTRPEKNPIPGARERSTPRPRVSEKVSVSGSGAAPGVRGLRKRSSEELDSRQMDLPLQDAVLIFRKRPK